jgi:hypothetical protein
MVGEFPPPTQDLPEVTGNPDQREVIATLQTDYKNLEAEALKSITDQPATISQTAKRLVTYLTNIADSGDASDFDN